MNANNPFIALAFEIPFERIMATELEPAFDELLERAEERLLAIEGLTSPLTFSSVMMALQDATLELEQAMTIVGHLESVNSSPELRQAYNAIQPKVAEFFAAIPLRDGLWKVIRAYSETDDAKSIDPIEQRYLHKTLDDFRRHGADLDESHKQELRKLVSELAKLSAEFSQNVVAATAEFSLHLETKDELKGLPASVLGMLAQEAANRKLSGYVLSLQSPVVTAVLRYADSAALRETIYRTFSTRAAQSNAPLIEKMLLLRQAQAKLLGYADFSDFVSEDRMAKTGTQARHFVEDLRARIWPFFEKENQELEDFAKSLADFEQPIEPWDLEYLAERWRRSHYDFDGDQLRSFFALDKVFSGMFEVAHRLYGITVRANDTLPVWHSEVRSFDILDEQGSKLASFYADLFPRPEKRDGAWMNSFVTGGPLGRGSARSEQHSEERFRPHLALMCANLSRPVGDAPALLTHREVQTMFHEFGHLLHHCLSRVPVRELAGTNVAWDFVELPSQIMENWCWQRQALDTFARHYQSDETIDAALYEKMIQARNYRAANAALRQLCFATLDLDLHQRYALNPTHDVLVYARSVMQEFTPAALPTDYAMLAGFGHLFSSPVGYAAGYYSYKWAEVLDADAFSRFQNEGIFNRDTGMAFRRAVLEKGNSKDPADLFADFMGRAPSLDALLKREGLSA
ncbi:MAG: M3 family metallopeptidase [Myxococcales bacterium]|nr:MAG: M3 family metallopeptidase [Myxococcales bacterium]